MRTGALVGDLVCAMHGVLRDVPLDVRRLGAEFAEFGGWSLPLESASGVVKVHAAVRGAVGIFDLSHLGKGMDTGPAPSRGSRPPL